MRFRNAQDERIYNALRSEMYIRLASHLPPRAMNEVLRNFGKIEGLLLSEGIRQGMAVARVLFVRETRGLSEQSMDDHPALVAHAIFYEGADTPLSRVEAAAVPSDIDDLPWLDASSLPFAPQTIKEAEAAYGPELEPSAPPAWQRAPFAGAPTIKQRGAGLKMRPADEPERRALLDDRLGTVAPEDEPSLRDLADALDDALQEPPEDLDALLERDIESHLDAAAQRELGRMGVDARDPADIHDETHRDAAPAFLDRVRDQLRHMVSTGWKPKDWQELILTLHREMQADAAALDIQLSTQMGRTILTQVGLFDIAPGIAFTDANGGLRFARSLEDLVRGGTP